MAHRINLFNTIAAALLLSTTNAFAGEDKITQGYNSMDSMGCMLVRECKKDVHEVYSLLDISSQYDTHHDAWWGSIVDQQGIL